LAEGLLRQRHGEAPFGLLDDQGRVGKFVDIAGMVGMNV
jgi:hypothetical protein